ncbi:zinc carboxypeptidase-like [Haliotis cracherodii]|uniref:zinc carboxypeptidase-like n=1 Tax=Haliotis cracherodii TaxID=6455 RepID=UPI0039EB052A
MMMELLMFIGWLALTGGDTLPKEGALPQKVTYVNHRLLAVTPQNKEQADFLAELENSGHLGLDVWIEPRVNHQGRVRVPPETYQRFVDLINAAGIQYEVKHENIQDLLDNPPQEKSYSGVQHYFNGIVDHTKYNDLATINNYITGFANSFSGVSTGTLDHTTYEGRSTSYIHINNPNVSGKKRIFIEAGIHAREWVTPASSMYFVDRMLHERSIPGSQAEFLYNNFEWYIVPVTNPDGYTYTHTTDRLWRKNRNTCSSIFGRGVDLNRNWDANFGGTGSSSSCFSDTFRGASVFSEAETRNIRDWVSSIQSNEGPISAYLSIHSYSQYLLVPYGYAENTVPDNNAEIRRITNLAKDAIRNLPYQKEYFVGTAPEILYVASGTSSDWARLNANIPYAMTYEMRPDANANSGFELPASEIIPTGEDLWVSMHAIVSEL